MEGVSRQIYQIQTLKAAKLANLVGLINFVQDVLYRDLEIKKTGEFQNEPNAEFCQGAKYAIDLALLAIARIRRNPELWTALLDKVQNRC